MKTVIALLFAALLSGCFETAKTPPLPTVEETTKAGFLDRVMSAANVPLFKLTCPAQGCVIGNLEVGNPFAVSQIGDIARVMFAPQRSAWLDFWTTVVNVAGKVGGYAVLGDAAARISGNIVSGYTAGFGSMAQIAGFGFDANGKVASMIPQPGAVTNTTTTLSGQGVIGNGQYIGPVQTTTTTNPNPRVCGYSGTPPVFSCIGG